MLRVSSPLSPETERLITRVIGCSLAVHRALGPGLLESIYSRAICIELDAAGLAYECQKEIPVLYRDHLLCYQRLDVVVGGEIVLEVKSVEHLNPVHHAQLLNYLHLSKLRVGLLMNFNVAVLKDGLKRIVL